MALIHDFVFTIIGITLGVIIHYLALQIFAPGTALHETASMATNLDGADRADFWYDFFVLWLPIAVAGSPFVIAIAHAYRRQSITANRPPM